MRLSGKTIVVTRAAHGIGRAYAERLASEGANVGLLDIDGDRYEGNAIRALYDSEHYPLERQLTAA